jgi:hypothetical protein
VSVEQLFIGMIGVPRIGNFPQASSARGQNFNARRGHQSGDLCFARQRFDGLGQERFQCGTDPEYDFGLR